MSAEGPGRVFGPEQAAGLKDGNNLVGESLEAAGQPGRHDVEPVGGPVFEPELDLVGHLQRRSGHGVMAPGPGEPVQHFAHGEAFPADGVQQQLAAAAFPACGGQQLVRKGVIQRQAVEVHAQQFAQDAEAVFRLGQLVEFLPERPGLGFSGAEVGADAGKYQEFVRVPALRGRQRLDVGIELLGALQRLVRGEHGLGVLGGERLPVGRGTCLYVDRPALRGPRGVQRPFHAEVFALVPNRMDPGGIGENARAGVGHHRAVLPAVPELAHHLDEFVRPGVALGVRRVLVQAEVPGGPFRTGGDDVPAGTPAAQVVQRREEPGRVVRLQVRGAGRADQADPFRGDGDRGQPGERLDPEPGGVLHVAFQRRAVRVEHRVQLRRLRPLRELLVEADVQQPVRLGFRVPPGGLVVAARVDEQVELQLPAHQNAEPMEASACPSAPAKRLSGRSRP